MYIHTFVDDTQLEDSIHLYDLSDLYARTLQFNALTCLFTYSILFIVIENHVSNA